MPPIDQSSRPLAIQTPLGDNIVGLRSFRVQERLGQPFVIDAELSSNDPDIKFDDIVGHSVLIRLDVGRAEPRFWHALVSRFTYVAHQGGFFHYRATLVPWVWGLTRSTDCRIFQELSPTDIVQNVFREFGSKDFELRLSGDYPVYPFCVQYRETDLNFVSRVLETEGIAYYFKHTEDKGQLVLADAKAAYELAADHENLRFYEGESFESRNEQDIVSWHIEHEVQPTQYALADYNYLKPKLLSGGALSEIAKSYGLNGRQRYDFPGGYDVPAEGTRLSRIRLEELHVNCEVVQARSLRLSLGAGDLFSLTQHPREDQNREYLVTAIDLTCDAGEFSSDKTAPLRSECQLTAIPSTQPYRPARLAQKPLVHGPQPAVVVGPPGEEIFTDEQGRVKVQFMWDRDGKTDDKSSFWIRVAQGWAGKKWGSIFLPRIGHEVLVEFMEGDPDRPVLTGSVYNGANTPPYALPAEKTKSTIKSSSTPGGGGFNEIRFEDKKGEEQIFVHGEKNSDTRIKNDTYEWVGHDRHLVVKNDQVEDVGNDRHEKLTRDHVEEIGRDHHLTIKGKEAIAITGSRSEKISDDVIEEYAKNQSTQVTKNLYLKAENIVIEATKNITINVGGSFIAIESGGIKIGTTGDIILEATGNIAQKATADLTLEATANVSVKGTAGLKLESPAMAELKSASTTVKGDGMVTIQGGLVKIN